MSFGRSEKGCSRDKLLSNGDSLHRCKTDNMQNRVLTVVPTCAASFMST